MNKNILVSAVFISTLVTTFSVQAERAFGEIYTDCGLGALIAKGVDDHNTADIIAIVTNVTWDLGTTAISSNLTTPDACSRGEAKTAAFILKSYPQLEKDLARGQGEYLDALMGLVKVEEEARTHVVGNLRSQFSAEVAGTGFEALSRKEKAEVIYRIVYSAI